MSSRNGDLRSSSSPSSTSRPRGGFDVSSLIGLTDDHRRSSNTTPSKSSSSSHPSPNMSVGPPAPPAAPSPSSLYPFLFHPGLYQHLASGFNPMLLNAQLALAAQHNPLLASAYAQHFGNPFAAAAAAMSPPNSHPLLSPTAERLRQHRFSPYSLPPAGSPTSGTTPTALQPRSSPSSPLVKASSPSPSTGSAFHTVLPKKSVAGSRTPSPTGPASESRDTLTPPAPKKMKIESSASPTSNDIRSMENLVNGLNGSTASKFGLSHDQREIST